MSIKAMTWAFGLPLEPRAKITLLAIADNANDAGTAFPGLEEIAAKSSQSRATVVRRIKYMVEVGLIGRKARYRPDGTQTTDLITLNFAFDVALLAGNGDEPAGDGDDSAAETAPESTPEGDEGGGYQPDTLGSHSCNPTPAVVTGGGLHSCNPQEPSSNQDSPPYPPPGGVGLEMDQPTKERFDYFFGHCIGHRTQTRDRPAAMFAALGVADQIACAAASPVHAKELTALRKKSLDAWKLIRDRYWLNYPDAKLPDKAREPVWIGDPRDIAALGVRALIVDDPPPRLIDDPVRGRGLLRRDTLTPDLQALAVFDGSDVLDWIVVQPDTKPFNAWRARLHDWSGRWVEPRVVMRRGTHEVNMGGVTRTAQNRTRGLPVPCLWPPRKDGTLSGSDPPAEAGTGDGDEAQADEGRR